MIVFGWTRRGSTSVFCIAYSVVSFLNVRFSELITSVGEKRTDFLATD